MIIFTFTNKELIEKLARNINPNFGDISFHICCVCYIFNSIMQDVLKLIQNKFDKITNSLIFVTMSSSSKQDFEYFVKNTKWRVINGTLLIFC